MRASAFFASLAQQTVGKVDPSSFQAPPPAVVGWIALALSVGTLVGGAIAWGKKEQKQIDRLDGFGGRVKTLEDAVAAAAGRDAEQNSKIDRVLGQHDSLIKMMGTFQKTAEQCSTDTTRMGKDIATQIAGVAAHMTQVELSVSQRLTAVETEVKLTRDIALRVASGTSE